LFDVSTATAKDAIVQTVLDYFEGWFDGDTARMERALHPDLAKRGYGNELPPQLGLTTAKRMLELTSTGEGKQDAADRRIDVQLEDVHRNIASVTVRTAVYHEYLHLVRTNEGWKIANALWEPT
jgi:hypothetical protein